MKKSLFVLLMTVALASLSSCKQKSNTSGEEGLVVYDTVSVTNIVIAPEYYFAGNFSYMADAANLKETVTGKYLPIAMEEQYPKLERNYMDMEKNGEPVYVELRGYLKPKGADEEGPANKLVITQVMTLSDDAKEESSKILTGTYRAEGETLTVNPDHTYVLSFPNGEMQGNWYLSANDIFVLAQENGHIIMDIDYPKYQLKTKGEKFTLYTRE